MPRSREPKLRSQVSYVTEWIDEDGGIERVEIFRTAAKAVAAADDGGDPALRDLVVILSGYYAGRGGPLLMQERKHAYWRLRGVWHVPRRYVEGGEIAAQALAEIAAVVEAARK